MREEYMIIKNIKTKGSHLRQQKYSKTMATRANNPPTTPPMINARLPMAADTDCVGLNRCYCKGEGEL